MFEFTHDLARLAPPSPEMAALLKALAHDQPSAERFFDVIAGTVAVQDFFSPANLERMLGRRLASRRAA